MYINGQKWVFSGITPKILTFEYYAKNKTYSEVNFICVYQIWLKFIEKWPPKIPNGRHVIKFFDISTSNRGDFPRIIEIALFTFFSYSSPAMSSDKWTASCPPADLSDRLLRLHRVGAVDGSHHQQNPATLSLPTRHVVSTSLITFLKQNLYWYTNMCLFERGPLQT